MSGQPVIDRKTRRRQETTDEILAASWAIVGEKGLAGLSMRDLGDRVGMRAQSLYSYFASKHEIYDAMFAAGYRQALATMDEVANGPEADPFERMRLGNRRFFEFCISDRARYQLLFQRTIPDFEPSSAAYEISTELYGVMQKGLRAIGVDEPAQHDLWTAVMTGLADQQLSNDPGGDRWARLVDEATDMLFDHLSPGWRDRSET